MSRRWMMLALPLSLAACQKPAETPDQATARMMTESTAAKAEIDAMATAYGVHLTAHHADSVAAMFTENGVMMPPNAPAVEGRDAIKANMTQMPLPTGATLTIHSVEVAVNGPLGVNRGTYVFSMPAMGHQPAVTENGKYFNHMHQVNGHWLIAASIWSSDAPAMPMPAMAPPAAHHN
jgi:ketosteroid isomerase-like protein